MKKTIYILISCVFLLLSAACTDWLEEEHKTKITSEFLYSDPEALERAVIALYSIDRSYFKKDEQVSVYAYMLDIGTDIDWFRGGGGSTFAAYNNINTRNSNVKEFWVHQYLIIGKCNEILAAAKTMDQENELVIRITGEASLFRAHAYYWLQIKFGRIYLTTEPTTFETIDKAVYTPAKEEDVWKLINDDLDTAIANLDWNTPATGAGITMWGRYNKAVAKHIKAKAAMWQQDWDEAIAQTEDIFESHRYDLLPNPKDVFEGANLNHMETLFAYQFKDDIGGGGGLSSGKFVGHRLGIITVAQYRLIMGYCDLELGAYGWGRLMPNNYLFSLYDKVKDKRFQQYFRHYFTYNVTDKVPVGKELGDTIFPASSGQYWENFHPQCTKFVDKWTLLTPDQTNSFKDVIMYRLAETYLIAAEAYMNKGDQVNARKYYNKTWMRAGNNEETRDITLQMIMDEHARELCMEGHRFSFLKRIGKLYDQVRNYGGEYTSNASAAGRNKGVNIPTSYRQSYPAPAAAADRRFYFKEGYENWPIPQSEIDQMGADNFPQHDVYK
ncbi:MAG: RagB/SusD family nutrient uptake outer membrane protein [Paludibacter sp.]|nr:RagB/SusD family nutrient uptake outer membrane protein [Paludibacter sp.]